MVNLIALSVATLLSMWCINFIAKWLYRTIKGTPRSPVTAAGAYPIVGHLPMLARSPLPFKTFSDLADKHGPIFTIRIGLHKTVVLNSCEWSKQLFTTKDMAVSNRPKLTAAKHLGYNFAMFSFAPHGAHWRETRKLTNQEMLSNKKVEATGYVRSFEAETSIKELYQAWRDERDPTKLVYPRELISWFGDLTLNMILKMVASKRYSVAAYKGDEEKARRIRKNMQEIFRFLGLFVARDALPFLGWLDIGGHEKAMKRTAQKMDDILSEWVAEHREIPITDKEPDFIYSMLSVLQGSYFPGFDTDTILKSACLNIIAGSCDPTTVTIIWAIALLLNNKDTLKKAQEELDLVVGSERLVNESDTKKLFYLQAIVKETLRLYPPLPMSAPRELVEDIIINGCHIMKGTRLILNLWKIQRDPKIWSDPLKFMPERFLTIAKDVDVKGKNYEFLPFGSGRRMCPGVTLGLQMVYLGLASFLHAFDVSTPSGEAVDMSESSGLTTMKATPLEVLISPRLPHQLYV